jgi:MFS family permease
MNEIRSSYRPIYAWTVVGLTALAYILSNIDRQLISVLIVPIERDLHLSDTQFGVLQGLAYGLFYAALCIPVASLSDRYSRSMIISAGFSGMFVLRALVGIEESSLLPAVYSLVGDLFPRQKLGRAMGIFFLAPFVGSSAAFTLGGGVFRWLGESGHYEFLGHQLHAWQLTFMLAAVPGFVLALVIALLVRDRRSRVSDSAKQALPPFRNVVNYLLEQPRISVALLIGFPLLAIPLYVVLGWAAAYLIRTQGFSSAHAGLWLGTTSLVAGCSGAVIAGFLTDALTARGRRAGPFEVGIGAALVMALVMAVATIAPFKGAPFVVVSGAIFFACFSLAPSAAVIQSMAPAQHRSRIAALFLVVSLVWNAVCNFVIGALNDHVFGGPNGIRLSLPIFILLSAVAAAAVLASGRKALAGSASVRAPADA